MAQSFQQLLFIQAFLAAFAPHEMLKFGGINEWPISAAFACGSGRRGRREGGQGIATWVYHFGTPINTQMGELSGVDE
jgi:hypothetical protein